MTEPRLCSATAPNGQKRPKKRVFAPFFARANLSFPRVYARHGVWKTLIMSKSTTNPPSNALSVPLDASLNVSLGDGDDAILVALASSQQVSQEGRNSSWCYHARYGTHLFIGKQPKRLRRPPQCRATTRKGTPCKCLAVAGKQRCKLHGGMSTGPKTAEGRAKIAESNRARAAKQRAARLEQTTE